MSNTEHADQDLEREIAARNGENGVDTLYQVWDLIAGDPARMAALGAKDRDDLGKLTMGEIYAYAAGAGLRVPTFWPALDKRKAV